MDTDAKRIERTLRAIIAVYQRGYRDDKTFRTEVTRLIRPAITYLLERDRAPDLPKPAPAPINLTAPVLPGTPEYVHTAKGFPPLLEQIAALRTRSCIEVKDTLYKPLRTLPPVRINGHTYQLPRAVYEKTFGPVDGNAVVRRACRNEGCVNPAHLELGSRFKVRRWHAPEEVTPSGTK